MFFNTPLRFRTAIVRDDKQRIGTIIRCLSTGSNEDFAVLMLEKHSNSTGVYRSFLSLKHQITETPRHSQMKHE